MKNIDFKYILRKTKDSLSNVFSDSDTDWKIILSFFIITLFCITIFFIRLFINEKIDINAGVFVSDKKEMLINTKELSTTLERYDRRAGEYQKIASTTFTFADPIK